MRTIAMYALLCALLIPLACAQSGAFVSLMPKTDVREHWIIEITPPATWTVKDGVIRCAGTPLGFLRSKREYRDFILRGEWRFETKGWTGAPDRWPNAGFLMHAQEILNHWPVCQEAQGYYGEAGSLKGARGGRLLGAKEGAFVRNRPPFGSWERYEVTSLNGRITVALNGELVNEGYDAFPDVGNICLQSEGWPVQYRNVAIKELHK